MQKLCIHFNLQKLMMSLFVCLFVCFCVMQPCCATFNNDGFWYRSEVIDLVCSDIVKILYVDYGNTAEIPLAAIRRPKLNYLTLPAQAIECRLCHVKPAGGVSML